MSSDEIRGGLSGGGAVGFDATSDDLEGFAFQCVLFGIEGALLTQQLQRSVGFSVSSSRRRRRGR
jgi:hypothetical protein